MREGEETRTGANNFQENIFLLYKIQKVWTYLDQKEYNIGTIGQHYWFENLPTRKSTMLGVGKERRFI